ncbi:Bromodomain associated domain protein [Talaromyces proteolyticus]|uniref:Bromodomain associated domain protein n=1 Tax=Talaromyces proteolyticus TaxID=1131652 RepID=A0AAD4KH49_9EURO|nr:Bromodomain associated domain protein [Talaromyces proteolyticus]KAH8692029.1 Bromodomain associated domain protein [Talaromyces proteolyticus]
MSGPQNLHNALLRPPIIQILRAAGYHSTRPSVLDTIADLAARYLLLLGSSTAEHAANSHPDDPVPTLADIQLALEDAGAFRPQMRDFEEDWCREEDMRGVDAFLTWFTGPANREIQRIAGFIPNEGDVIDADLLEKEDFLTAMKKKHSKTGEESRYAGTVLGKDADDHPVLIEGGAATSIGEWNSQVKSQVAYAESISSTISSVPSSLSDPEGMDI